MDVDIKTRWFKRLGMAVVFIWLTAQVAGAQFLVEYAKSNIDSNSSISVMVQYFFLSLQFLVGGIAWDVLKKIKNAEINWSNVLVIVVKICWYFLCMLAFLVAAFATSTSTALSIFFILCFIVSDVMVTREYFSFMKQIREGVGKYENRSIAG